jgi:hypothetical protein
MWDQPLPSCWQQAALSTSRAVSKVSPLLSSMDRMVLHVRASMLSDTRVSSKA